MTNQQEIGEQMTQTMRTIKTKMMIRTLQRKKKRTLKSKQITSEHRKMVRLGKFQTRTQMKGKMKEVMEIKSEAMKTGEIIEANEDHTRIISKIDLLAEMIEVILKEIMRNFTKTTTFLYNTAYSRSQLLLNFQFEHLMMILLIALLKKV